MKRHYRYMLNLASFGLLIFALYLNFIKKEPTDVPGAPANKESAIRSSNEELKTSSVNHATQTLGLK